MSNDVSFTEPYWCKWEDKEQAYVVIFSGKHLTDKVVKDILKGISVKEDELKLLDNFASPTFKLGISVTPGTAWNLFKQLIQKTDEAFIDVQVIPLSENAKRLLVCDMDSTIVTGETLDDVANHLGIGETVSTITERAMRGELDFKQALDERVGLLKGVSEITFCEVAKEVRFNPGAEKLLRHCRQSNIRTVLVSGGFEPIVKTVANTLGFDRYVCNTLESESGRLTGKVVAPVVDAATKLTVLQEEANSLTIELQETCAVGDGANDLPMLQAAGLGVAYQGKPLLRQSIPYQLNGSSLDLISIMMGIVK